MDMMFAPLRKYADFYGRATRTEYWLFFLFRVILFAVLLAAFIAAAASNGGLENDEVNGAAMGVAVVGGIVYLALLLPELAVTVRRLHDQDMSGWLSLLKLAPMGDFVLFIFMLLQGTAGANRHGPDPRAPAESQAGIFA
jgi:uncharacterized membrane protein YhaH (DUF805 family)